MGEPVRAEEHLGPYRLLGRVGEGGMGVVHLALDPGGRAVAVKVLRPHLVGDPDGRHRLRREAEALQRVVGPHVAEVVDVDVDGPTPYLAMRYVQGRSLPQHVTAHGPLRGEALRELVVGLARALVTIHSVGVVHRDLKPGNVLLADGSPVVVDFGVALLADDIRLTSTGLLLGTPGYVAPEVLGGLRATPASDVSSWGATVAYAATGRPPYGSGHLEGVLHRVLAGSLDLEGVPGWLLPLVRAATDLDPAQRPTAVELLEAAEQGGLRSEPPLRPLRRLRPAEDDDPAPTEAIPPPRPAQAWPDAATQAWGEAEPIRPAAAYVPEGPEGFESAQPPGSPGQPAALLGSEPGSEPVAADVRPQPALGLLAGIAFVAAAVAAPVLVAAAGVLLSVLFRSVDAAGCARRRRREAYGPRRSDGVVAVASLPWHLLRGALGALAALPVSVLAASLAVLAALALGGVPLDGLAGGLTEPERHRDSEQVTDAVLATGALLALTATVLGPGRRTVRRGFARTVQALLPAARARVLAGALLALACAVLLVAALSASPTLWPFRP
ncbi:serine/threonine-protein kinase [Motilibacter aurantiacus]|uniref:serine/threonine-protein kinase n=1 Tax=Motilibacter aurantiacus TaxID=2714955 RepID=UPI00140C38BA|nr:protein kinase [Motilibacter aurantiacus]